MKPKYHPTQLRVLAATSFFAMSVGSHAASGTWSNLGSTDGNWSTASNWDTVPGSTSVTTNTDVATFNTALGTFGTSGSPVVIDSATQNIGGISFTTAAGNYVIGSTLASNVLKLTSAGTIQILSTLSSTNAIETINENLSIQAANGTYNFLNNSANGTAAGAGTLNFGGTISGAVAGATVLTLGGTNTNANTISGIISNGTATSLAITKSGAGLWVLSGANTYTGGTTITGGTLKIDGGGTLGASASYAGTINVGANQFIYNSSATQTLTGSVTGSGGTFTVNNGVIKLTGGANKWNSGPNLVINTGAIFEDTNGGGGQFSAQAMTISGNGTFKYSGSGTIFMANGAAFQSINMSAGGKLWVASGTMSDYNVKTTNLGDLQLDGILQQPIGNDEYFNSFNGTSTGQFIFTTTTNGFGLRVGVNDGGGTFAGVIKDGTGTAGTFTKVGVGTQVLSGANTYTKATNIQNGTLQLGGADNRLSASTVITLGNLTTSGKLILGSTGVTNVTDSKSNLTVAGLLTSGTGTTNAVVGGNASVSTLTVNLASGTNTYAGILGGVGTNENNLALTKSGAGTLTLSGTNTYTGTTTVSNGTLQFAKQVALYNNGAAAAWSNANIIVQSGATMAFNIGGSGEFTEANVTTLLGLATSTSNGFNTGSNIGLDTSSGNVAFVGGIANPNGVELNVLGLAKLGANTLTLPGTNTYTGATSIAAGRLVFNNPTTSDGNGNGGFRSSSFTLTSGATLEVALTSDWRTPNNSLSFTGTGTLVKSGAATMMLGGSTADYASTVSLGSGSLIDIQGGKIELDYGYNKTTWASNKASVNIATGATFDLWDYGNTGANYVKINALTGSGTIQRGVSGTTTGGLEIGVDNGTGSFTGTIINGVGSSTINLIKSGTGTETLSGANTYTGTTIINAGTLAAGVASVANTSGAFGKGSAVSFANTAGATLQITGFNTEIGSLAGGGTTGGNVVLGAATLTTGRDNTSTSYAGAISGTGGGLTKIGTGTQTFTGANAYTGATTINGGTLAAGVASVANTSGAFGKGSAVSLANIAGATLQITGFNTEIGSLAGGGTTGGNVILGAATLTTGRDNTSTSYAGAISGTGGGLTKIGTGTQTLSGASTYTGATTINGGTLAAGVASVANTSGAFGIGSAVSLANTAGATMQITGFNTEIGSLAGGGTTGGNVVLGAATLTTGRDNSSTSYAGIISGTNGGLTKIGTGNQTLTGANTYTGTTTVQAGTLTLGASGTISSTLVLGVSGGTVGTLDLTAKAFYTQPSVSGSGTLNIGAGTINVTTALAPGFSPGTINVTGNLALAGSTTTTIEVADNLGIAGTSSDYVNVSGTLALGGALNIASYNGYSLATLPATYNLFDAGSVSGDFSSVNIGAISLTFNSGTHTWSATSGGVDYSFNENNDVLTVVPEPASALLGGLGMLFLLRRRRH